MGDTIPILDYGELLAHTLWLLALACAVIRLVQWVECRLDAENHALWRASLRASALVADDANLPDPCALCGAHAALVERIVLIRTQPHRLRTYGEYNQDFLVPRMAGVCSSCANILSAVRAA